jgi:hypothetical protein
MEWLYNHIIKIKEKIMIINVFWLIWLLRSLGKAVGQRNNGFGGLGQEFYRFICHHLGGHVIATDVQANWTKYGISGILGNYGLPITSTQYWIPINQIPLLLGYIIRHP